MTVADAAEKIMALAVNQIGGTFVRSVLSKRSGIGPTTTNHGLPPSRPSAFAAEVQRAASRGLSSLHQ